MVQRFANHHRIHTAAQGNTHHRCSGRSKALHQDKDQIQLTKVLKETRHSRVWPSLTGTSGGVTGIPRFWKNRTNSLMTGCLSMAACGTSLKAAVSFGDLACSVKENCGLIFRTVQHPSNPDRWTDLRLAPAWARRVLTTPPAPAYPDPESDRKVPGRKNAKRHSVLAAHQNQERRERSPAGKERTTDLRSFNGSVAFIAFFCLQVL